MSNHATIEAERAIAPAPRKNAPKKTAIPTPAPARPMRLAEAGHAINFFVEPNDWRVVAAATVTAAQQAVQVALSDEAYMNPDNSEFFFPSMVTEHIDDQLGGALESPYEDSFIFVGSIGALEALIRANIAQVTAINGFAMKCPRAQKWLAMAADILDHGAHMADVMCIEGRVAA